MEVSDLRIDFGTITKATKQSHNEGKEYSLAR